MIRLALFFLPPAVMAAGWQLHHQHVLGVALGPQQQAITTTAAAVHRAVCQ